MNDLKANTAQDYMNDSRCCGTGHCIIDQVGECWCGQKWDGEKMSRPSTNQDSNIKEISK